MINFLNYFASQGGFDAIINLFKASSESADKLPVEMLSKFTNAFKCCNYVFDPEFSR